MRLVKRSVLTIVVLMGSALAIGSTQAANVASAGPQMGVLPLIQTPTPFNQRLNGTVRAPYLAVPPAIDGNWSDWPISELPFGFVIFGAENWWGPQDLNASYKVGWDQDYLYLALKIIDDKYVQNAATNQMYKGDSYDILLDANVANDFSVTSLNEDDFQLGISPGRRSIAGIKEAWMFYPVSRRGPVDGVVAAGYRRNTINRIEMAIPWSLFGITPISGAHYGFVVGISDNDDGVHDVQQTYMSTIRKRILTNPTTWGDLSLQ